MYVCKYATLQACHDEMAAPLDLSVSVCEVLQLNSCQFVRHIGMHAIVKPISSDFVVDIFLDSSCFKLAHSIPLSGSKCTSVYQVRFAVCDISAVIKNRMLHLLA